MSEKGDSRQATGIVYIIGVGPGDPRLITVRGRDLIERAAAIVFDSSVSRALLPAGARAIGHPELYDVGRRQRDGIGPSQGTINELLIRLARSGKRVARLTGGDPFVFGRGSEEAQALNDASVPFEVVPGITAGIGAASYAGIPVTHRGLANSVTLVAGNEVAGAAPTRTDWGALAKTGGTIVIYMGRRSLVEITRALIEAGMSEDMPAAAVQRGTRAGQETLTATVGTLNERAAASHFAAPSIVVIGWPVILRDELDWYERSPLFGKRIAVSAPDGKPDALSERLQDIGARIVPLPRDDVIRLDLSPLREELTHFTEYGWIIFATAPSVRIFWEQMLGSGRDARALAGLSIAAVGADTAGALLERGITVDVIPHSFTGEALLEMLGERDDVAGSRILLVAPERAESSLAGELAGLGAEITTIHAYRNVPDERSVRRFRRALERGRIHAVALTSASGVRSYVAAAGDELAVRAPAASIGASVSEALTSAGIRLLCEAEEPTIDSLVAGIEHALS